MPNTHPKLYNEMPAVTAEWEWVSEWVCECEWVSVWVWVSEWVSEWVSTFHLTKHEPQYLGLIDAGTITSQSAPPPSRRCVILSALMKLLLFYCPFLWGRGLWILFKDMNVWSYWYTHWLCLTGHGAVFLHRLHPHQSIIKSSRLPHIFAEPAIWFIWRWEVPGCKSINNGDLLRERSTDGRGMSTWRDMSQTITQHVIHPSSHLTG